MATRIAVDIGGTFTDLVYHDDQTGQTLEGKVPTVPLAPEKGVRSAILEHVPADILSRAEYFLHGTTVGLNALLERRGAKVGLITTKGFRDVLEIRRGDRAEMYNLFWEQTKPLVPRRLRLECIGRMMFDGSVYEPLDEKSVELACKHLLRDGVDSIAVCLAHAYANPAHEKQVEAIIRENGFSGSISLSHKISGEYREYERTSTTAIDAFVKGRMANYLKRLESELRELGFNGKCLITRSGGGSMSFAEAEERPFETIMSGPVGGAQGASELAKMLDIPFAVTADVGGTSFDTALIVDGEPQVLFEGVIDNMPIQSPWVDVRSIGAGGGSIAHVDVGNFLRVGPQSAGADPGPACYCKGGTLPTLTDAAAWLGMLGEGNLASGIKLDTKQSDMAIEPVAKAIQQDIETTASGILRIAASAMANAMREISVEQGLDARDMVLMPFGGAGAMMACLLADEMKMKRIVIPPFAGNFSAWGLLGADMVQSASRTHIMDFDEAAIEKINITLSELFRDIRARVDNDDAVASARLDLRYKGQEHTLSTEVELNGETLGEAVNEIIPRFKKDYERAFGTTMNDGVEIVSVRATLKVYLPKRKLQKPTSNAHAIEAEGQIDTFSFAHSKRARFVVRSRDSLAEGANGPMIITEGTTTTYVDAGWQVSLGNFGEMILERRA